MVHLNNFDHHADSRSLPPACRQAFDRYGRPDPLMARLVTYVCNVDQAVPIRPPISFPSLSNVFSGMRIDTDSYIDQFWKGLSILREVYEEKMDPFREMPETTSWQLYLRAKKNAWQRLRESLPGALYGTSPSGLKIGFMKTPVPGALGALYAKGCQIAVAFNPVKGKYTVGGKGIAVSGLLPALHACEAGWGGHATIIGSPEGSQLPETLIIKLVQETLKNGSSQTARDPDPNQRPPDALAADWFSRFSMT